MDKKTEGLMTQIRQAAQAKGGECLSTEFTTRSARYTFRCARGHEWETAGRDILRGAWCLRCSHIDRSKAYLDPAGLDRLKALAAAKGGECLATEYRSQSNKYPFRCQHGHEWETTGQKIINGAWCPQCARQALSERYRDPQGLQRLQAQAEVHGGACLSPEYTGAAERYRFRCAEGHEWDAIGASVLAGAWCRKCAGRRHSKRLSDPEGLAKLQEAARQQGGECLSDEYTALHDFYVFRCNQGHSWRARGGHVLKGQWCARCRNEIRKLGIEVARRIAQERGGRCLSEAYEHGSAKLKWQCGKGHEWEASMESIRQDHWCPRCAYDQQRERYRAAGLLRLKNLVKARGGILHSKEYTGQEVKYAFECHRGHFWHTRAMTVFKGAWCPECAHAAQLSNPKSKARPRYGQSRRHRPDARGAIPRRGRTMDG